MRLSNRREAETVKLTLLAGEGPLEESAVGPHAPGHLLHVTVHRDGPNFDGNVRELFFVGRGKSGYDLDRHLDELGLRLSRRLQGRDPESGTDLDGATLPIDAEELAWLVHRSFFTDPCADGLGPFRAELAAKIARIIAPEERA